MRVPRFGILLTLVFAAVFGGKTVSQQLLISNEGPNSARVVAQSSAPRRIELEASTNFLSWSVVASTNGSFLEFYDPNLTFLPKRFFRASFTTETNAETLQIVAPLNDAVVTTNRPTIEVAYSGFNANSTNLVLRSSGTNLPTRVSFANNRAVFELVAPLREGFVTIYAARLSTNEFGESLARVDLNVRTTADNLAPVAEMDFRTTQAATEVVVPALANDRDPNGDSLVVASYTQGTNGVVALQNGTLKYTPNADFTGTDRFKYTVSDGRGGTATGDVRIAVLPMAGLIAYVVDEPMFADEFREIPDAVAYVCNFSQQLGRVVIRTERPLTIGELRINCPVEISREDDRESSLSGDAVRIISEANLTLIGMNINAPSVYFEAGANLNLFRMRFGGPTRVVMRDNPIAAAKKIGAAAVGAGQTLQIIETRGPALTTSLNSSGAVHGTVENFKGLRLAVNGEVNADGAAELKVVESNEVDVSLRLRGTATASSENVVAAGIHRSGITAEGDNKLSFDAVVAAQLVVNSDGFGDLSVGVNGSTAETRTHRFGGANATQNSRDNVGFNLNYDITGENGSAKARVTENRLEVGGVFRTKVGAGGELELGANVANFKGVTLLESQGKASFKTERFSMAAEFRASVAAGETSIEAREGKMQGADIDYEASAKATALLLDKVEVGADFRVNGCEGVFVGVSGSLNADFTLGSRLLVSVGCGAPAPGAKPKKSAALAGVGGQGEFVVTNCTFNVSGTAPAVQIAGMDVPVRIERNTFLAPTWGVVAGEIEGALTIRSNIFIGCGMGIDGDIEGEGRSGFAPGPYLISGNTMTEGYAFQAISIQDAKMAIVERNEINARSGLILSAGYAQVSSNLFNGATNGSVPIRALSGPNGPAAIVAISNTIVSATPLVLLPDSYARFESNRFVSVVPQGSADPEGTSVISIGNGAGTVSAAFRNNQFSDVTIAGTGPTYLEVSGNRGTFKEIGVFSLPPQTRTIGMVFADNILSGDFPEISGDGVSLRMRGNQINDVNVSISANFSPTFAVVENNQFGGQSSFAAYSGGFTRLVGNSFGADSYISDDGVLVNDPGMNTINTENISSPTDFNNDAEHCADYPTPEYNDDPIDPCNNGPGDPIPLAPIVPAPVEPPWPVF